MQNISENIFDKRLQDHFKQAPVAICILRGNNLIVELANDLYLQLVDRQKDFIGKPLFDSLAELESQGIRELLTGVIESGKPFLGNEIGVAINRNGNKENAFFDFIYQPLKDEDSGIITGIMVVCTEVTEKVLARQKINESERKLNVAIESAELGPFELNVKTREVALSDRYLLIFGFTLQDKPSHEELLLRIHPEDRHLRNVAFDDAIRTGQLGYQMRLLLPGNVLRWIMVKGRVFYDNNGVAELMLGTVMDVSQNKKAEERINRANRTLEIALEAAHLGTFELDIESGKSNFNEMCKKNYDFPLDMEVTIDKVLSRVHPDDKYYMQNAMQTALKNVTRYTAEYRIIISDGSVRWISSSGKGIYNDAGKAIKLIGVNADVTERKKAEEELHLSFEKFRLLADSMPQFIWTGDPQGNLNYFNQSVYDFSGLSVEQIGKEGWLQIVHMDDREENIKKWVHSIQTGEDFLFEHRFKKHDGQYRWQLSRAIPQKNKNGEIQMWVGTSTDIHDQKEFAQKLENLVDERTKELKQANIDLEMMNQELSSFAYISSHDLQEPLRKIQTFISRIQETDSENLTESGKIYFGRVHHAANKMKTLINDLLTYSKTNASEKSFEKTDLSVLLREIKNEFGDTLIDKKGSLEISPMPVITGIPFQLRQLFINLISNAIKFSKNDTPVKIKINSTKVKGNATGNTNAHHEGNYYHITVSDNGIGFPEEYAAKIFEVFQKLHGKNEYEGTGIGLSICKKIAQNHHGFITATSEINKGTTFNIYIPVSL